MYSAYVDYLKENLSEHRFVHSLNVANKCAYLAKKYNYDENKAYFCGLIHDVCKNETRENMLQIFERFGIILDNVQMDVDLLWHSIAGALFIQEKFGVVDEEIINAVRYHTTGRKNMTKLDKIVFLADIISADRSFDGVEYLRDLSEMELDVAVFEALKSSIMNLISKGAPIHNDTIDAYNSLAPLETEKE